jgi:hypothetical protein
MEGCEMRDDELCRDCARLFRLKACQSVNRPVESCPLYKKIKIPKWIYNGAIVDVRSIKDGPIDHPGLKVKGSPFSSCNGPAIFVDGYPGYTTLDFVSRPKKKGFEK